MTCISRMRNGLKHDVTAHVIHTSSFAESNLFVACPTKHT